MWGALGQEVACCGLSVLQSGGAQLVLVLAPLTAEAGDLLQAADVAQLTAGLQPAESLAGRLSEHSLRGQAGC